MINSLWKLTVSTAELKGVKESALNGLKDVNTDGTMTVMMLPQK